MLTVLACSLLCIRSRAQSRPVIVSDFNDIRTFEEMIRPYLGKVIFIDLWATWCGPCRREFAHAPALSKFARENDVVLLYVSTDKGRVYTKWADMISYFKLNGYHLIARGSLREELFERFFDREEMGLKIMSVPHYVIVDRNGQVVERDAKRPSSGVKLFRQLYRFL